VAASRAKHGRERQSPALGTGRKTQKTLKKQKSSGFPVPHVQKEPGQDLEFLPRNDKGAEILDLQGATEAGRGKTKK